MVNVMRAALVAAAVALATVAAAAGQEGGECEVCVKVVEEIKTSLEGKDAKKMEKWEEAIDKYCGTVDGWGGTNSEKKLGDKEKKLCYAISPIKREIARPASMGMPPLKACQRAAVKDEMICEIKFPKPPTDLTALSEEEIRKMRVRKLKDLLKEHSLDCKGCVEKDDFVKEILKARDAAGAKKKEL